MISIREILIDHLVTNATFQRDPEHVRIKRISGNISDRLFGVPEVALYKGKMIVVDGQHRIEAAKTAGRTVVLCRVHEGLKYSEIVEMYRKLNKERKPLTPFDDFKAALDQQDPDALSLNSKVLAAGFTVSRSGGPNQIGAVVGLRNMYKLNEAMVTDALLACRVLIDSLEAGKSLTREIIEGVHIVFHYHPDLNRSRLAKVLGKKSVRGWMLTGEFATNSERRPARMAESIRREYNLRLRNQKNKLTEEVMY